jgi:hypothetical protein
MGRTFGDPNAIVTTLADRTKIGYHVPQQVLPSAQGRVHSSKTGPFHLVKVDMSQEYEETKQLNLQLVRGELISNRFLVSLVDRIFGSTSLQANQPKKRYFIDSV